MPYCEKCGASLSKEAQFCPNCGTPVTHPVKKEPATQTPQPETGSGTKLNAGNLYGRLNLEKLPKGHLIDDRYEIIRKLGQGSFGAVYLAYDRQMEIQKALKIIPEALSNDKEAMLSLKKEAAIMVKLNHPNIVRVYDFHHNAEIKYIDMEYVDGVSLADLKLEKENKKFPEEEVKKYALQIAEGLAYAHNQRVIHKDIKPQNIMLTQDGTIKLMDFGIAETVHSSMSRLKNTGSSGTLVYMSPEQLRGKDVGKESDIYSLGATLYELLTGNPPFYQGDITYQIINETPKPIEGISQQMNDVVLKCLEKDLRKRFGNCKEPYDALKNPEKFLKNKTVKIKEQHESATSKSDDISENAGGKKRHGWVLWTILLIVIGAGAAYYIVSKEKVQTTFVSIPEGSVLYLDGNKKGTTPLKLAVNFGEHEIRLVNGKHTIKKNIFFSEKSPSRLNFKMNPFVNYTETAHSLNLEMVAVKGGTFQMGSNDGPDDEKPVHTVTLSNFYIGKYEVTQKQWKAVMGNNPSLFKGDDLPVENVSWHDVQEFLRKLNQITGKDYRLPTEAEWEYAARGGDKSLGYQYSGSNNINEVAWYDSNSNLKPHPVGQKAPNELSIYDMSGNVSEWCSDWYRPYYYSHSPVTNPRGPTRYLGSHVLRGGSAYSDEFFRSESWPEIVNFCRVACRGSTIPGTSCSAFGFRVVR